MLQVAGVRMCYRWITDSALVSCSEYIFGIVSFKGACVSEELKYLQITNNSCIFMQRYKASENNIPSKVAT